MELALCRGAPARLHLLDGRPEGAASAALEAGRRLADDFGIDHPGLLAWRPLAAVALHAAGRPERSRGTVGAVSSFKIATCRYAEVPPAASLEGAHVNDAWTPTGIDVSTPSPARMYDYCLGGKDNYEIDRAAVMGFVTQFGEGLDVTRANRLFLYRVVRYLAEEAGIRQFLDMGSGLPTQANVHEIARRFQPDPHVVYVDSDPIVLAHGRALLSAEATAVIQTDMTDPRGVLAHPDVQRIIDFDQPVAALFLSVAHSIPDDGQVRGMFAATADALAAGSFLAVSQFVGLDGETARAHTRKATEMGLVWKTRTIEDFRPLVPDLEPVPPGLVDVADWRPDPGQPALSTVDEPLRPFLGAAGDGKQVTEFGGVLRKN
ncbi:hypothetical protein E1293_08990 [Actinomadura darangshiensis]|uniref:SAM-dependent methyltransferase n=1 Tax=Actinomadura darangshiensis TaxID=705336 RepID=A0A4R5BS54_9ACTN|nr:SAM-dependent methyltransferase [Actinomadura darangshiensis]TDD86864.1 hypothetical protein E1293_08990 [Actinomadura darangshiensis]